MRLTTVILVLSLMQVSAATFGQKVTLTKNNMSISQIFTEIRKQTGYGVFVSTTKFKTDKRINIDFQDASLKAVMDNLVAGTALTYTIEDKTVVIKEKESSFLDRVVKTFQDISVSGVVLDSAGKALPGASVTVKGTLKATTSGDAGQFFLQNIKEGSILVISYVGYETQEVTAVGRTLMQIRMIASTGKLQEVIVNAGYYTVKESERTGSISRITSKEIERQPVTNILAAMQGQMAGVNIIQRTGMPGGEFHIEIRGRNSLRNTAGLTQFPIGNDPLYIIDGMPYSSEQMGPTVTNGPLGAYGPSPLNGINPADVESIEVLKDADATAIYGSRGANGVVLITTKKGKPGKTAFALNAYSGASKVARAMKLMNTQQYLEMRREAFKNDGHPLLSTHPYYGTSYDINGVWDQNRYTDWQKELIGNTNHINNINAQVSGGNGSTTFLMGGTYNQTGTVFPGDFKYKIGAFNVNMSHKSNDQRFSAEFSGKYVLDNNNLPAADLTNYAINLSPNSPALYKENGEVNWSDPFSGFGNPAAQFENKYLSKSNTLNSSTLLAYKILPSLEIKATLGFEDKRLTQLTLNSSEAYNPAYGLTASSSSLYVNNAKNQSWNIEPRLNWQHFIGKGKLEMLVGTTIQQRTSEQQTNYGFGFLSNDIITNITAATTQGSFNNLNADYRYSGILGRMNYNWDGKYILNLTARRDGSSRFGPGKQFGNFGAIALAWLFGKEERINKFIPALSSGKIRTTYGTSGSDSDVGDYDFLNTYSITGTKYQGTSVLSPTQLFNPDYSWASAKKFDVALDLGFLNDRILFTANYYRNRISNQLVGIPLPGTTGFRSVSGNLAATVQNAGWEFELNTLNIQNKQWRWSTSLNLTINRNKLISFPGLEGSTYANQYIIGEPTYISKVYHYIGINTTTGVYQFQDYNNNGLISNPDDRKIIVNLNPKYQGGIANSLTYKNFALNFLFQFAKQNGIVSGVVSTLGTLNNQPVIAQDRWQNIGDNRTYQRYTAGLNAQAVTASSYFQSSDGVISDASFIRLKNVDISYSLPKSLIKVASCRVFLQAQNLATISNYKGLDPETPGTNLPPLRTITAGLQLSF